MRRDTFSDPGDEVPELVNALKQDGFVVLDHTVRCRSSAGLLRAQDESQRLLGYTRGWQAAGSHHTGSWALGDQFTAYEMGRKSRAKKQRREAPAESAPIDLLKTAHGEAHRLATSLAHRCANRSASKYADAPDDIVRGALFIILQDALITHNAILVLVRSGYASSATANLRTLLDLLISTIAVIRSRNPSLMAFRYFYSGYREFSRDAAGFSRQERAQARQEIRRRIDTLPPEDRQAALEFLNERDRSYFFSEEWRTPAEVLRVYPLVDLTFLYRKLSSAAHGGFMGLRTFRDEPDSREVRPKHPPGRRALTTLLMSARFLGEIVSIKSAHESLDLEPSIEDLRRALRLVAGSRVLGRP